jgi:hypothetical protein
MMFRAIRAIIIAACLFGLAPAPTPADAQQQQISDLVSGSGSATGTSATTIIAAPSGTRRLYISSVECARSDAGTSAIYVTLNDDAGTIVVLPNSGGGGANNLTFPSPLTVAAATALKFTASTNTSTVYCSAAGFSGN